MHQSDSFVLVLLVLASLVTVKLAPGMTLVLLGALIRYRRAASK
jgi:hypothetical protein